MDKITAIMQPIRGDVLARREDWIAERDSILAVAGEVREVADDKALDRAGSIYTEARRHAKALETERLKVTQPLDAVKKQIMADEKAMRAALESEAARLKALCDAYATRKAQEAADARMAQAEAEAEADRVASVFGAAATVGMGGGAAVAMARPSANRMVERWAFAVRDPAAVPREFLSVDESKIRAWTAGQVKLGITPRLPGVEFVKSVSVEAK